MSPTTTKLPVLTDYNREEWRLQLQAALQAKGLWRFVKKELPDTDEVKLEKALGIINTTLPLEYRRRFMDIESPHELWKSVNRMYDESSSGKIDAAESLLNTFIWENGNVEEQYERFIKLRGDYEGLGGSLSEEKYGKLFIRYMKINQFTQLKQSLICKPLPISEVISLMRQHLIEEKLMVDMGINHSMDLHGALSQPIVDGTKALAVGRQTQKHSTRRPKCWNCGENGHYRRNCPNG